MSEFVSHCERLNVCLNGLCAFLCVFVRGCVCVLVYVFLCSESRGDFGGEFENRVSVFFKICVFVLMVFGF